MAEIQNAGTGVPEQSTVNRFTFHGTGAEYFGIWIVNILLTIVTVGIYSAWAKVRRNRYFYGNLELMGSHFDYHARGGQIFKGRLIVFGFFILINIAGNIFPPIAALTGLIILAVLPFLVARGLRFSTRVTSYRNVRFNFVGTAGGAFKAIVMGPILSVLTVGIMIPFASRWFARYLFDNLRYGDRPFMSEPPLGRLYKALVIPLVLLVVGGAICAVIIMSVVRAENDLLSGMNADDLQMKEFFGGIATLGVISFFLTYVIASLVYRAMARTIVLSSTIFDDRHPLSSDMSALSYVWVSVTNVIVSVITFGLARPWAACRYMRLVSDTTAITINGDVGTIMNELEEKGSVASAEFMDVEGIDFGF